MKRPIMASLAILFSMACLIVAQADDHKDHKKEHATIPALERFAQLAGDWVGTGMHGDSKHEAHVSYKVTSGGSAVVETFDAGTDHEMITVIHPDGDSLLLTHYCMLGNQPHMKATPKPGDNKVAFQFVKVTNVKSDKDMYMHDVTFTFVDKDHIKTEWTNYDDGKEAGKATFDLKRKK